MEAPGAAAAERSGPGVESTMVLRLEVLGPLQAWLGDTRPDLGQVQQRVVLAVLAINANRPLGRDQLVDAVWGSAAPTYAVNLLQKYMSRLRRVLEPVRSARAPSQMLTWTDAGYLFSVPAGCLDLDVFDRELARSRAARSAGDLPGAAQALHAALALWRGPAFDGLTSPLLDAERERLAERRIGAIEDRIDIDLALGNDEDLVAELRQLISDHPLRERLRGLLMRALYRSGRQAEALAAFRETQHHLITELGVEPMTELQELHQRMLRGDAALAGPQRVERPAAGPPAVALPASPSPAQLPHGMPDFAGRDDELARLNTLLTARGDDGSRAGVTIVAITGTAGVGKTSLAVHWAHQIKHLFPDGQFYVNLRGFDPQGTVLGPDKALRSFLDACGVPPQRIPTSLEAQAALYRSVLADRRVLVVLDNARNTDQVLPLLPGSPGCLVVVTGRNRMSGLLAAGAVPLTVDLLTAPEARRMLGRRIGQRRVDAEPAAVDDIAAACARLPLALAIVAARAAFHPQFTLTALAGELREARGGLDAFVGENASNDARAVLSWSYRTLSDPAARLFRLLGLHPGPHLAAPAAASVAGLPLAQTRRLLAELSSAHLLDERAPGRFAFHDLLRAYAAEQAELIDNQEQRTAALGRLFDHYLTTARAADRLLYPYRVLAAVDPPDPAVTTVTFRDTGEALGWLQAEHPVLLASIDRAVATGFDAYAWRMVLTITPFLHYQGHWHDWTASLRRGLEACRHLGDVGGQADAHRLLNVANAYHDRFAEAGTHAREAMLLFAELGDHAGAAQVHLDLARASERQGHFHEAIERARQAVEAFRLAGDRGRQADALNVFGRCHSRLGYHEQALTYCNQALELHQQDGAWPGFQADTWRSLGYAHHQLGQLDDAIRWYDRALALWRDVGDRYEMAIALVGLGDSRRAAHDNDAARAAWLEAQSIFDDLGRPEAEQLRLRLARPAGPAPDSEISDDESSRPHVVQ